MHRSGFKHLLLFLEITQKGFSFLCMRCWGVEVTNVLGCMRNPWESARRTAVWDPGWVPVNQDIYLETTLQFGNGAGCQGGKGWGSLGILVSLTTWTPFPLQVHGKVNNEVGTQPTFSVLSPPSPRNTNKMEGRKTHNGQNVKEHLPFRVPGSKQGFLQRAQIMWTFNISWDHKFSPKLCRTQVGLIHLPGL